MMRHEDCFSDQLASFAYCILNAVHLQVAVTESVKDVPDSTLALSERSLVSSDARNARIVCSRYAFENFHVGASVSRCCSSAISSPSARSRACAPSRSCRNCSSSRCFLCSNSTTICAETFASVLGCGWITRRGCAVRAGFTLGGGLPSITAKNPPTPPFFLFVTSYTFLSLRFCCQAALSFRLVERHRIP